MIIKNYKRLYFLLAPVIFIIFYLTNFTLNSRLHWHDSQRIGQILLMVYVVIMGVILNLFEIKIKLLLVFLIFIFLGLLSSFFSKNIIWSLTELSIFIGSYAFGFFVYRIFCFNYYKSEVGALFTLFLTASSLTIYFMVAYMSSLLINEKIDVWQYINGFSNPRFFGQFLTLLLPVLMAPVLRRSKCSSVFFALSCMVCFMLIASGTRGSLLGLGSVAIAFFFVNRIGKNFVVLMVKIALIALVMQYFFIDILPRYLQIDVQNGALDRKLLGLSARDLLWGTAIFMVFDKPLLGYGPMHFSNMKGVIASHPHQFLLQIMSEWGLLFFVVFFYFSLKIIYSIFRELIFFEKIKDSNSQIMFLCLSASIFASLMQSMVDGVFVMPYTEIIFSFMASWLAAVYYGGKNEHICEAHYLLSVRGFAINLIFIFSVAILLFSFCEKSPTYIGKSQKNYYENEGFLKPRFWINGGF